MSKKEYHNSEYLLIVIYISFRYRSWNSFRYIKKYIYAFSQYQGIQRHRRGAVAHKIVSEHKGEILVNALGGKGTLFEIRLPLSPDEGDEVVYTEVL